jgi:lipopolysaccharide transport system ATP-binding protein
LKDAAKLSDVVIRAEGLGKSFRLQHQRSERYVALRDVLASKARSVGRWLRGLGNLLPDEEEFWALRDVSFEVRRGEVIGIIGRNGAGKSTLLKVLSRITEPSEGRVRVRGRVASLLEVGTGFHPELTGRENVFVNGAILGMSRAETKRKFDEIVAFAEVERFLDTPVKRYSSGMYVRLAFAVAAHLEPEILVVDEVLAVGDAQFQKKCLGKMHDAGRSGRTVLFVSHNMAAMKSLTTRSLVMDGGRVGFNGPTGSAIEFYMQMAFPSGTGAHKGDLGSGMHTALRSVRLLDEAGGVTPHYIPGKPMRLEIVFETDGQSGLSIDAILLDANRSNVALASLYQFHGQLLPTVAGTYACVLEMNPLWLASGQYSFDVTTSVINADWDHYVESAIEFQVPFSNPEGRTWDFMQSYGYGPIALLCKAPAVFSPAARSGSDR